MENTDNYKTPLGEVRKEVLGHASLFLQWNGKNIYVDPYSEAADYSGKSKADLIIVTHNHYDHYDKSAYSHIETPNTIYVVSKDVGKTDKRYEVLNNYELFDYHGLVIKAVPAYNIINKNPQGNPFHPKGEGNGYILDFGGYKIYIAGDTELIPEMEEIPDIEIALLPKNLPYTMSDEQFLKAANLIKPKYLYPIHYFELDSEKLSKKIDSGIIMVTPQNK